MFKHFLKNPVITGALCSSSKFLGREITSEIGIQNAKTIVELGPGTGALTSHILEKMDKSANFFTVELNPDIIETLAKNFPDLKIYQDSAANLPEMIKKEGMKNVDVIVSGLPWAAFPSQLQEELLNAIIEVLAPDGVFTTFAYKQGVLMPAYHKFKKRLQSHFSRIEKSSIVWRNIPPAFVYRCRK